jgi:hypothetical protein
MWAELIERSGFDILDFMDIQVPLKAGTDHYLAFIQQKR